MLATNLFLQQRKEEKGCFFRKKRGCWGGGSFTTKASQHHMLRSSWHWDSRESTVRTNESVSIFGKGSRNSWSICESKKRKIKLDQNHMW